MNTLIERILDWLHALLPAALKDQALLEHTLFLIPLFPLLGFLLNGLFGRRMEKKASGWIGVSASLAAFVWACFCAGAVGDANGPSEPTRNALHAVYGTWLNTGEFTVSFGFYLDQLSSVMILVVTGIGTLIHIYSIGYMAHDEGFSRFFAYLNLFLFAMILLVLGDNLLVMFVGWEGVGLCSYLLIGFWYEDGKNAAAGMKAFVVNRIGDLGFILGLFTLIAVFGTLNYTARPIGDSSARVTPKTYSKPPVNAKDEGFVSVPKHAGLLDYADALRIIAKHSPKNALEVLSVGYQAPAAVSNLNLSNTIAKTNMPDWTLDFALTLACTLLFIGAMGKSAQFPLYVWLPDAMAGPTPVSALIHAATMVTAGVYMVCRLHGLFALSEQTLRLIAIVGGFTALWSALIGLTQLDIKKVLAYSTVSQLGYMFLGLGVGAFSLGIFHVLTHAFFKALLFLAAGSVIHAMSGEQDMRYMGGLRKKLPVTFWTMLIGAAALAGVPYFSGWYSKDEILVSTLALYAETHQTAYLVLYAFGVIAAFCTAFYTFRLICLTFFGECRAKPEVIAHIHESPPVMLVPLVVLAAFSVVAGVAWHEKFTVKPLSELGIRNAGAEPSAAVEHINFFLTLLIAAAGIGLACWMYGKGQRIPEPEKKSNLFYRLSLNKFYLDEFYDWVVIMPFTVGSELMLWIVEMLIIDMFVTTIVGGGVRLVSGFLRRMQTGLLNSYAAAILIGALALLFFLM